MNKTLITDPTAKNCPSCGGICAIECDMCFRCEMQNNRRRLTRQERLQRRADSGCDTWEEDRGER
jgi:hypothetical protein